MQFVKYSDKNKMFGFGANTLWLALLMGLTFSVPSTIYSFIFAVYVVIELVRMRTYVFANFISPVSAFFLIGFIGFFNSLDNEIPDVLKDFWYLLKVVICFCAGYLAALRIDRFNDFLNLFVRIVFVFSIIFLVKFISGAGGRGEFSLASEAGLLPLVSIFTLPLIAVPNFGFVFYGSKYFKLLIFALVFAAISLSFSRTMVISSILVVLGGFGFLANPKRTVVYFIILASLSAGLLLFFPEVDLDNTSFFGKLKNSFSEISFVDGSDPAEMIANWRGFEAYHAYSAFSQSTIFQQVFGRGFGATVDIGMFVEAGEDQEYRFLPILHNGYWYIITKFGMAGLLAYTYFVWITLVCHRWVRFGGLLCALGRLKVSVGLVIAFSTLVITGVFNKHQLDGVVLLLGALHGYSELIFRGVRSNGLR